jgi:O-succinylbenzoate synthase
VTNSNKRRGDDFERKVAGVLWTYGFETHRMLRTGGHDDHGDIVGIPGVFVECRNRARLELAQWIDATRADAQRLGQHPIVVFPRRGKSITQAYVLTTLDDWATHEATRKGKR